MLTTKHTGQTLWLNKKETEDPWMPMIKRTAGEKLLTNYTVNSTPCTHLALVCAILQSVFFARYLMFTLKIEIHL